MSAAASALYVSQPTVSQAISELEDHYGVRLFERLSRRLYITEAGRKYLDYARHIVALFDEMEGAMMGAPDQFDLHIGATVTVGTCVMNQLLASFQKESAGMRPRVYVDNTRIIEDKLLKSELDIALVEGTIKSDAIVVRPLIRDELILVCPPAHPFCSRKRVSLSDLAGEPFVLREEGSGTRELFEQKMTESGLNVNAVWQSTNTEAITNAVRSGQGLTVVSRMLVERELRDGSLVHVPIAGADFHRDFCLVYHKNKFLSEPLKRLIRLMEEFGDGRG